MIVHAVAAGAVSAWEAKRMLLRVEVFPVEVRRWVALIEAPERAFSTECARPEDVPEEVDSVIRGVLRIRGFATELVDDLGRPWSPAEGRAQSRRLGIV